MASTGSAIPYSFLDTPRKDDYIPHFLILSQVQVFRKHANYDGDAILSLHRALIDTVVKANICNVRGCLLDFQYEAQLFENLLCARQLKLHLTGLTHFPSEGLATYTALLGSSASS